MIDFINKLIGRGKDQFAKKAFETSSLIPKPDEAEVLLDRLNNYFDQNPEMKSKFQPELNFINTQLEKVPVEDKKFYFIIPYAFSLDFDFLKVLVLRDPKSNLFYVLQDGKKLFYHSGYTNPLDIQRAFTFISLEQHPKSPHRYLGNSFDVTPDDIVVDLGAAEGNFSLMIADIAKELIIVEADPIWMEALTLTFAPWKQKVTIINKFVGTCNDEQTVTIDRLASHKKITAIKMDIEGAELSVLQYAEEFLETNPLKLAITVYHKKDDEEKIGTLLQKNNYVSNPSDGYMLFIFDDLTPPFFRRSLIYANNINTEFRAINRLTIAR